MEWQTRENASYIIFVERQKIVSFVFAFLFLVLSLTLFNLQIVKGNEYRTKSDAQRIYNSRERAPRGNIYSSDNKLIVGNRFIYTALFTPYGNVYFPSEEILKKLSEILGREVKVPPSKNWKKGKIIRLAINVDMNDMFKIQEQRFSLPGISIEKEPSRVYNFQSTVHLTGYTSEISNSELKARKKRGYEMGDYTGRTGIEEIYDDYLVGEEGGWQAEVNAKGYQTKIFKYVEPKVGADVYSTVDLKLQEAAFEGLEDSVTKQGAAIVIDVKTGAVKALVSCPVFDAKSNNFVEYISDVNKPLYNRALQGLYPPGSIFKTITFSAGIDRTNVNPDDSVYCKGCFELGNRKYACWYKPGHGTMNLLNAMAQSCNVYFYQLGLKVGVNNIEEYSKKFHLGEKTGIDLPNEKEGFVPSREWKKRKRKTGWLQGDTAILAIGQGDLVVTPLQMAQMTVMIANKGTSFKPFIVEKIMNSSGSELFRHVSGANEKIELSDRTWNLLHRALVNAVENGTARGLKFPGIKVAAKTGTAQNSHGDDHAWCISFAPADDPQIAVAVLVENGGGGGTNAVPIVRKIYEAYFNMKDKQDSSQDKKVSDTFKDMKIAVNVMTVDIGQQKAIKKRRM
jgi:penicillin-binding protein 2